jgi:hypothetical protein
MLVAPLGFLNANDLNEVRLPVVKYLASQRIQFNTDLGNLLHCHPPSFDQSDLPLFSTAGRWITSRNQMRTRLPRVGSCLAKPACLLLWIADRKPRLWPLSSASRALRPGGSDFAAQGFWASPHPSALGGAPVIPRKIWPGPVLPPPEFLGVAMGSCLPHGAHGGCARARY